ncbi:helix-hairpin-helix domain-containing protein [Tritonibacter scottomollicae]|uniref:Helix-hairpin-helix domain-containing protein n=1 Tax=Tritonibacter scottomollicae TaxID=483013 RepID=A0ABZ0HIE4_TRISK|nr:helix-hairpin-helix domain-containing protein [Tritonibacter scottomollicae]WOI34454.1 helix-hairpin-helix domain-containing protein [Tritonibacter scottomollicae]
MTPILKLPGVGPALAKALQDHGVRSVEDLAAKPEAELAQVPGLGVSRVARLKSAATELAGSGGTTPAARRTAKPAGKAAPAVRKPRQVSPAKTKPATIEAAKGAATRAAQAVKSGADTVDAQTREGVDRAVAAAEAARLAAEEKAAKAEAKAEKAAKKAKALMAEFAAAKEKAKSKAKKEKGKAKSEITKEKAKAKKILSEKSGDKKKKKDKDKGKKKKKDK